MPNEKLLDKLRAAGVLFESEFRPEPLIKNPDLLNECATALSLPFREDCVDLVLAPLSHLNDRFATALWRALNLLYKTHKVTAMCVHPEWHGIPDRFLDRKRVIIASLEIFTHRDVRRLVKVVRQQGGIVAGVVTVVKDPDIREPELKAPAKLVALADLSRQQVPISSPI